MIRPVDPWLVAGGACSALAALAHLAAIAGGPGWYRAMGAGERMARMVEQGRATPHLLTLGIAAILSVWAAYALSGTGLIGRLPLLRTVLCLVTAVYLLRGLALFHPALLRRADLTPTSITVSSLIVLVMGLIHAIGLWRLFQSPAREF